MEHRVFMTKCLDTASAALLASALLSGVGCGGSAGGATEGASAAGGAGADPASGAEQAAPSEEGAGAAKADTAASPAADADSVAPKEAAKPSPWGNTLDKTGKPLPKRAKLAGGANKPYDRGVASARAGETAAARKDFEKALAKAPKNYQVLYNLGVVADHDGKEGKALDYYKKSLRSQPDYEMAAAGMVAIYIRNGQVSKADAFAADLARKWERNLHLQALYADVLTHQGKTDEASIAARKALRRDEKFVPAMISLVKANLRAGRVELAESVLAQAVEIEPKNAELHYLKGNQELEQGRLAQALKEYRQAVELRPEYAEARMALGIRLLAGANYSEALTHFKAVAKLAPKLVEVHLALGDAYRASRKWKKAKESFDRALRMKKDLAEAHYNLGLMYMTAGADYPGLDLLGSLGKAKSEFGTYRSMLGSKLARDDASGSYIEDIDKQVAREQKRIEREAKRKKRDAERAARKKQKAAEGGDE